MAALAALCAVMLTSFVFGYSMKNWSLASWIGAAIIVIAAATCMKCRLRTEEEGE